MTRHPSVAVAALAAGALVCGGAYAARHDGSGADLAASTRTRQSLARQVAAGTHLPAARTLAWHRPRIAAARSTSVPVTPVTLPTVAPVAIASGSSTVAVTRTSPAGAGGDGAEQDD